MHATQKSSLLPLIGSQKRNYLRCSESFSSLVREKRAMSTRCVSEVFLQCRDHRLNQELDCLKFRGSNLFNFNLITYQTNNVVISEGICMLIPDTFLNHFVNAFETIHFGRYFLDFELIKSCILMHANLRSGGRTSEVCN